MESHTAMDLRFRFSRTLSVVQRRWNAYLDRRLKELGLSLTRWHALVELSRAEHVLNQNELALRVGIEKGSLVHLLDSLESKGLIRRVTDTTDRRSKRVELLPAADDVLRDISAVAAQVRGELLDGVSDEAAQDALEVLDRITVNLDAQ